MQLHFNSRKLLLQELRLSSLVVPKCSKPAIDRQVWGSLERKKNRREGIIHLENISLKWGHGRNLAHSTLPQDYEFVGDCALLHVIHGS